MDQFEHLGWFILAGWLLNLTPGPDVLFIVANALRHGVRAGMVAALGITAGCFVHIFAAGLGVGALLATSATAFAVLKWTGAAYLAVMGVRLLMSKGPAELKLAADVSSGASFRDIFFKGFLTNALNPKVAVFFLAFVPQFIAPGAENKTWAFIALGVLFNVNALPINFGYAALSAWAARRLGAVQRGMRWMDRIAGAMFIGFGLRLALTDNPPH
jgi:threonine/homoserine/homoserine lactone efflux protein